MSLPVLNILNLELSIHSADRDSRILNGVSLRVEEGNTLTVVGVSGCGKTVMLHTILRLLPFPPFRVSCGQILYQNRNLLTLKDADIRALRGKEIGMIFQNPMSHFNPVMRVGEHFREVLRCHLKMSRKEAVRHTLTLLEQVGFENPEEISRKYPHEMSGGQGQRTMIALSLACEPHMLLADEPTSSLDVASQELVLSIFNRIKHEKNCGVLFVTHDIYVAKSVSDYIAVLFGGRVMESGRTEQLLTRPVHPYTRELLRAVPTLEKNPFSKVYDYSFSREKEADIGIGCPYVGLCTEKMPCCKEEKPPVKLLEAEHICACWHC